MPEPFVTADHRDLLAEERTITCDACGGSIPDEDASHALRGEGEYVWARGEDVRRELAPLCPTCATAIFGAAIASFEVEEEG